MGFGVQIVLLSHNELMQSISPNQPLQVIKVILKIFEPILYLNKNENLFLLHYYACLGANLTLIM